MAERPSTLVQGGESGTEERMSNTLKKQLKRKRRAAKVPAKARRATTSGGMSSLASISTLPDRRAMDGVLAQLFGDLGGDGKGDAVDRAQQLMYRAWEARDSKGRVSLARKALAISADCADAYVLLAEHATDLTEARQFYEQGVAAGERALGPDFFEENEGSFWGLLETRPYMRARAALASVLWQQGERDAAVGHYEDLLRLNPNDNQGVRQLLVGYLIELDREHEARQLLQRYKDDGSAWMVYGRALLAFRGGGDSADARRALAKALKANPFVAAYLTGRKRMPLSVPDYHGFGDESEAVAYAFDGADTWRAAPGAIDWLSAST
jgi:tetratricopeptide (TPR) repeat protein